MDVALFPPDCYGIAITAEETDLIASFVRPRRGIAREEQLTCLAAVSPPGLCVERDEEAWRDSEEVLRMQWLWMFNVIQ